MPDLSHYKVFTYIKCFWNQLYTFVIQMYSEYHGISGVLKTFHSSLIPVVCREQLLYMDSKLPVIKNFLPLSMIPVNHRSPTLTPILLDLIPFCVWPQITQTLHMYQTGQSHSSPREVLEITFLLRFLSKNVFEFYCLFRIDFDTYFHMRQPYRGRYCCLIVDIVCLTTLYHIAGGVQVVQ